MASLSATDGYSTVELQTSEETQDIPSRPQHSVSATQTLADYETPLVQNVPAVECVNVIVNANPNTTVVPVAHGTMSVAQTEAGAAENDAGAQLVVLLSHLDLGSAQRRASIASIDSFSGGTTHDEIAEHCGASLKEASNCCCCNLNTCVALIAAHYFALGIVFCTNRGFGWHWLPVLSCLPAYVNYVRGSFAVGPVLLLETVLLLWTLVTVVLWIQLRNSTEFVHALALVFCAHLVLQLYESSVLMKWYKVVAFAHAELNITTRCCEC